MGFLSLLVIAIILPSIAEGEAYEVVLVSSYEKMGYIALVSKFGVLPSKARCYYQRTN